MNTTKTDYLVNKIASLSLDVWNDNSSLYENVTDKT